MFDYQRVTINGILLGYWDNMESNAEKMWRSSGISWRSITGIFDGDRMRIHHEIVGFYEI